MRKEIDLDLDLPVSKEVLLDHHSVFNLLNILQLELESFLANVEDSALHKYREFVIDLLITLGERKLEKNRDDIETRFVNFSEDLIEFAKLNRSHGRQVDVLLDIIKVAVSRLEEFKEDRFNWRIIPVEEIRMKLVEFFRTIEKVSRERFHVAIWPGNDEEYDYLVKLQVEDSGKQLFAPPVIHDVMRDLAANSRKYSPEGSSIYIRLEQIENRGVKLVIKDEGLGIPVDEIADVVRYKGRASNVKDIRTMGEGFGLTKAYHVCKYFNGTFAIESELNNGTTIELTLFPGTDESNGDNIDGKS